MSQLTVKDRNQQVIQRVFVDQAEILSGALAKAQNLTPEKLRSTFMQVALRQPQIFECTQQSILETVLLAARLDLDPSGHHNGAHFVPFKEQGTLKLKLMLGYNAMIDLATRDGRITSFQTGVIYADEKHQIRGGTSRGIDHEPKPVDRQANERPVWYYAIAWFPGGGYEFEAMSDAQVEAVRVRSQQKDGPPWKFARVEMGKKTALRRLIKRLPLNPVLGAAIAQSDEADGFEFSNARRTVQNTADSLVADILPGRMAEAEKPSGEPTDADLAEQPAFNPDELDIPY